MQLLLMALLVVVVVLCAQCLLTACNIDTEVRVSSITLTLTCPQQHGPSVRIATRYAATMGEQFGGWDLILFAPPSVENSSNFGDLIHNIQNGVYQFRVELSPADQCHCINVMADLINNKWCPDNVMEAALCANNTATTTYLSQPVQISSMNRSTFMNCSDFAIHNRTDVAVAYEGRCAGCSNCRFPLATLDIKKLQVTISFSLIMMYMHSTGGAFHVSPCPRRGLNSVNEGILLRTNTQGLHFYYSQSAETNVGINIISSNDTHVIVNNGEQNITLPSTRNSSTGPLHFTLNNADIVNKASVSLSWEQRTTTKNGQCSVWALDNVLVNLHHCGSTRTFLSNNFLNNASTRDWEISGGSFTTSTNNCIESSGCIYFDQLTNDRMASTPFFDTKIVTAVRPPLAPTNQSDDTSQTNCTSVKVRFQLSMHQFQYPNPCNDNSRNGIIMAIASAERRIPMAYFTPLANTNWRIFFTDDNDLSLLLNDNRDIPVYSTQPDQMIEIGECVFTGDNDTLTLGWRQEHYEEEQDYWFLNISSVQIDDITISNINMHNNDRRYSVFPTGEQYDEESDCFQDYMFRMTENNNTNNARYARLVFNLTEVRSEPPTTSLTHIPTTSFTSVPSSITPSSTMASTTLSTQSPASTTLSTQSPPIENIIDSDPVGGLMKLLDQNNRSDIDNTRRLDLLRRAFNVQSSTNNITDMFIETSLRVVQDGIDEAIISNDTGRGLLYLLDDVALSLRRDVFINITNIVLRVQEVSASSNSVLGIAAEDSYITLPSEVFSNMTGPSFVASYFFKNISNLLPGNQPVSPVLSASLFCNGCRTSSLTQNVSIFFPFVTNKEAIQCRTTDNQSSFINDSFWSASGCYTKNFSNGSVLCSCNHLTHFAILLSPGAQIPPEHEAILTTIGQVFVTFSLIFLLATILIFVINKTLWSMRNYIHVMLCANMFVAQLLFVVGIERTENTVVCSIIAVLLHYIFLVVFMWMLMEGVVLYVALVRVFIKHPGRYIAGYTIASYVVPLIYMALVVPIGFLVNTDDTGHHYGYYNNGTLAACWLRYDTHFIWAFISPVIVIILANIGFLIMALVIMYRHFKKQQKKSEIAKAWHWIKVILALVVVMGIAWIGNILFFHEALLFVAYIMTIFIAGQGIFIFILFVPLSEQVRHAYLKWWRNSVSQSSFLTKHFTTRPTSLNTTTTTSVSVQHNNISSNATAAAAEENVYVMTNFEAGGQDGSLQEAPNGVETNEKVIYLRNGGAECDDDDSSDDELN